MHYFITLYFALYFAFLIPLLFGPPSLLCSCSRSPHVFALYALFYLTLLYFHSTIFRLLCIASFLYITSLRFTSFSRFASLSFLGPVSAPVLTLPLLLGASRASFYSLLNLLEPRAILLPLIPFCSVSREPGALEKSEPD